MTELNLPNSTVAVVSQTGVMTVPWYRSLLLLLTTVKTNTPSGVSIVYTGVVAPVGWTIDTTVGMPSLPAGKIWIKKE